MDTYLSAGAYSFVNRILLAVYDTIKVNDDISLDEVLGYLTITFLARHRLPLRDDLLEAGKQKWGKEYFIGL